MQEEEKTFKRLHRVRKIVQQVSHLPYRQPRWVGSRIHIWFPEPY